MYKAYCDGAKAVFLLFIKNKKHSLFLGPPAEMEVLGLDPWLSEEKIILVRSSYDPFKYSLFYLFTNFNFFFIPTWPRIVYVLF